MANYDWIFKFGSRNNISSAKGVESVPTVLITSNSDGFGNIVPVSLDGVTTIGAKVLFSSTKLKYLNYVVFPLTSTENISNFTPIF